MVPVGDAMPQTQQMAPSQGMQPQMQPQAGGQIPPEMSGGSGGSAQQQEIAMGKVMQILLLKRIGEMSQEELEALDSIITPESITVLAKLLPELIPVFENASAFRNDDGGIAEDDGEGDEGEGMVGSQNPLTQDDTEDKEEPMMRGNPAVSQGLVR